MLEQLSKIMPADLAQTLGVTEMSAEQQEALARWGLYLYELGQHVVADIEEIKYGGHVVVLGDGSHWEVDESDTTTVEIWGLFEKVLVADGEMWKLDPLEKVPVSPLE